MNRHENKIFLISHKLVGGCKKLKLVLSNAHSCEIGINSDLHCMQLYTEVSQRFAWDAKKINLRIGSIIMKPEDSIRECKGYVSV
jgi:hypothetical protein